jgi:hypothetical protein
MYKDNIRDDKKKIRYKCAVDTTYEDNIRQKSKDDCIWSKCYNNSNIKQIGISDSKVVYVLEKYTSRGLSGGGLLSERRRPKKKYSTRCPRSPHSPHNSHGEHGLHGDKDYDDETYLEELAGHDELTGHRGFRDLTDLQNFTDSDEF